MRFRLRRGYELDVYGCLIALRVAFALLGMGYIHPDEYFQNGEVTAGLILGLRSLETWEWDAAFPCRSIGAPLFTTGIPFAILRKTFSDLPPRYIFAVERLSFLLLSFVLDYSICCLAPTASRKALILFASSSTLLTFQMRPFSNSVESILLVLLLITYQKLQRQPASVVYLSCLAIVTVVGIFNRITFLAFATPIAFMTLFSFWHAFPALGPFTWFQHILVPTATGLVATAALTLLDSYFFSGSIDRVVFTPYNLLKYNLSSDNLAKHGLHPRWLHVTVNLPLVVGPATLFYGVKAAWALFRASAVAKEKTKPNSFRVMNITCVLVIVTSLAVLSVQPHQEPRFLVPLLVPSVVLVANSSFIRGAGKWFWMTTVVLNGLLSLIFGVLHQGGVVPSLLTLHDMINPSSFEHSTTIIYWKTYMPPRHLLSIPKHDNKPRALSVIDMAGSSQEEMQSTLLSSASAENHVLYLVTPPFAMQSLDSHTRSCLSEKTLIFPHLDLDHISESVAMGWREGLSLGIYPATGTCLGGQHQLSFVS